jgi:signal transduction histidine kinase/DNA-binding response OmpR family regulator
VPPIIARGILNTNESHTNSEPEDPVAGGHGSAPAAGPLPAMDHAALMYAVERPVFGFDAEGRCLWMNAAAEKLCGQSAALARGRPYSGFVLPADRPRLARHVLRQRRRGTGTSYARLSVLQSNGTAQEIALRLYRVVTSEGGEQFLAVVQQLAEYDEELETLRARVGELTSGAAAAEETARLKAHFLATVSHEIRTPMNGILGMTNLLLETVLDRDQRGFAEIILSSAKSLLQLVDDVLDFSKVEAGKLELETIDFDLRLNIDQVAALLAPRANAKSVGLVCNVSHEVPSLVRGDPGRIRQVVLNLAGNALKFTEKGEVGIRVERVEETATQAILRFSVSDTGIGMTPDQMARLFQTYNQVDSSIARRFGGTGLGLSISKNLVGLMGGEIGVSSSAGDGSTFWFKLPLEKQFAVALASPTRDALRGLRVMVVDPARSVRLALVEMLKGWDCEAVQAETAHAALVSLRSAAAAKNPVAVALVDMHMPGMEGEALGRTVRQEPALNDTRLVLLTSLGRRGDAARARDAGFNAYLIKPVQQLHLHDALIEIVTGCAPGTLTTASAGPLITRHSLEEKRRQRIRILVAEDDAINQLVATAALKRAGYIAEVAATGAEALAACEREPFDLIFMDGNLPDMDGMSLAREVRRREQGSGRHVPIVAMTAMTSAGDRERFLESGMDDYLPKPIDLDALARTVVSWVTPAEEEPVPVAADAAPEPEMHEPAPPVDDETPATAPEATEATAAEAAEATAEAATDATTEAATDTTASEPEAPGGNIIAMPTPDGPVLDREQLEESCMGSAELRRTLVQTFMGDVRPRMARLDGRVAAGDTRAVEFEAHGLKGMCGAIGAVRCAELFRMLEDLGRDQDLVGAPALLSAADEEVGRVEGVLAPLLNAA